MLSALPEKGDPLIGILAKKSVAGRKPIDALVLLRMLALQSLYNLSDEQIEYQVRDRLSFTRFLALGFKDRIPDETTLWAIPREVGSSQPMRQAARAVWTGQGRHDARGVEEEAGEDPAERQGRALNEEAWPQVRRLQEPCECRYQGQVDPRLHG